MLPSSIDYGVTESAEVATSAATIHYYDGCYIAQTQMSDFI